MADDKEDEIDTGIGKALEAAWNESMGEDTQEVPDQNEHLEDVLASEEASDETEGSDDNVESSPEETAEASETEEATAEESEEQEQEQIDAPQHWAEADREMFAKLDRTGQDFLLRRHKDMEADYTRKVQGNSEQLRLAETVNNTLDPRVVQEMANLGVDKPAFVSNLIAWHKKSMDDPVGFVRDVAKNLKLEPSQIFQTEGGDESSQPAQLDPAAANRLAELEARINSADQQRAQEVQQRAVNEVQSFANEMDANGTKLRPHFEAVKEVMGKLMLADDSIDLQTAYELAVYRDTELRSSLQPKPTPVSSGPKGSDVKAAKMANINGRRSTRTTRTETKKAEGPISLRDSLASAANEVGLE